MTESHIHKSISCLILGRRRKEACLRSRVLRRRVVLFVPAVRCFLNVQILSSLSVVAWCLYNGYLKTRAVSAQLFVSLDVYAIDVFEGINLSTLFLGKYKVIAETCQDDNELRFLRWAWLFSQEWARLFFRDERGYSHKRNYEFNDAKRTLLRQKNMDAYCLIEGTR